MQDPACSGGNSLATARPFQQHRKFVTAQARRETIVADAGLKARADHLQQLIADSVAVDVVDRLETGPNRRTSAQTRSPRLQPAQSGGRVLRGVVTIGQASQRIVTRQRLRACFRGFAFADLS